MNTCGKQMQINDQNYQEKHKRQKYIPPQGLTVLIRKCKNQFKWAFNFDRKSQTQDCFSLHLRLLLCVQKKKQTNFQTLPHPVCLKTINTVYFLYQRSSIDSSRKVVYAGRNWETKTLWQNLSLMCQKNNLMSFVDDRLFCLLNNI